MFTPGFRTTIIFEIDFCYLYRAMSHLTRELKDLTAALKVELKISGTVSP